MKKTAKLGVLFATVVMAVASGTAIAQSKDIPGAKNAPAYVLDPRGNVVVDPFGLCWRTPWWTPQLAGIDGPQGAGCQCDKAVLPKEVCEPPPPPPPPPSPEPDTYLVQPGDTLWLISSKVYGSGSFWRIIFEANLDILEDPSRIRPGQVLKIPPRP